MFTLHGLWPNYPNGGYPAFCDKSAKFDPAKVADLQDDLNQYWMSYSSSNNNFWKHEWEKHGTCATPVIKDEHTYFSEGLRLHRELDIMGALGKHGITPTANPAGYKSADLVAALRQELGASPILKCTNGALVEVWFCINRDLKVFECATGYLYASGSKSTRTLLGQKTCKSTVQLPPLYPNARRSERRPRSSDRRLPVPPWRREMGGRLQRRPMPWANEGPVPEAFIEV